MAAATLSGYTSSVFGNERVQQWTSAVFAANSDTVTSKAMKTIKTVIFTPTTNTAAGFTVSTNTITLVSGGALTGRLTLIGD